MSNKASLTALFQTGDIPTGANYADFIDSCVNTIETSAQSIASKLQATELVAPRVSATNINSTGDLTAGNITFTGTLTTTGNGAINISSSANVTLQSYAILQVGTSACILNMNDATGNISITGPTTGQLSIDAGNNDFVMSDNSVSITTGDGNFFELADNTGDIGLQALRDFSVTTSRDMVIITSGKADFRSAGQGIWQEVGVVSAAGTAQATAALLTRAINRGKGIVDGSTTGFRPPSNQAGRVQYIFNEGASANLWPPVGGKINGLATDAAFSLAASAGYTIIHLTASSYAVHG